MLLSQIKCKIFAMMCKFHTAGQNPSCCRTFSASPIINKICLTFIFSHFIIRNNRFLNSFESLANITFHKPNNLLWIGTPLLLNDIIWGEEPDIFFAEQQDVCEIQLLEGEEPHPRFFPVTDYGGGGCTRFFKLLIKPPTDRELSRNMLIQKPLLKSAITAETPWRPVITVFTNKITLPSQRREKP